MLLLVTVLAMSCTKKDTRTQGNVEQPSQVAGLGAAAIAPSVFDSMPWGALPATLADVSTHATRLAAARTAAGTSSNEAARFLCGLIDLFQQETTTALDTFMGIPRDRIPAEYLYAPYRLHRTTRPDTPNPFREPLLTAISNGVVNRLVAARVYGMEGRLRESLQAYLQSDPADWTDVDVELLSLMRLHAGLAREAERAARGALRGGRIPAGTASNLAQRIVEPPGLPPDLLDRLGKSMTSNAALRAIAEQSAEGFVKDQRDFLAGRYGELLGRYRNTDALQAPDKTTLLLVLCAARQADRGEFDRWSDEIRRRNPSPNVNLWLNQLKSDIK